MKNFECRKCHKPLTRGRICDACKQKGIDGTKNVVGLVLSAVGLAVTAITFLNKGKDA